jgi:hypothetical protein
LLSSALASARIAAGIAAGTKLAANLFRSPQFRPGSIDMSTRASQTDNLACLA